MKMQRGGNVFSFDSQCCWFTHDHGECILFYKGEVNIDGADAWNDMFETLLISFNILKRQH